MVLKGFVRKFRPLEFLSEEMLQDIHRGTLEVLEKTGVRIEHDRALKLLKNNGCDVDFERKRVRLPPSLVEECLRRCPSSFHTKARNPRNDLNIGGNTVYFMTLPGMQTVDLETWVPRTPTKKEYCDGVTVLDALENLHMINCYTPYFGFEGVPPVMAIPEGLAVRIKISSKFHNECHSHDCEIFNMRMAKATGQEIMVSAHAASPLTWYGDAIEVIFRVTEAGFPLRLGSNPTIAGSAPSTIAGAVIVGNAELITGAVLAQLSSRGARVLVFTAGLPMNMKTGAPAFGSIGSFLHQVVGSQVWRSYGVPVENLAGGWSSSKRIDFQCGYEKSTGALTAALSGANVILLHGCIHGELSYHPVQSILDDDVAGMIGRFIEGVDVNDDTLAVDLIEEVGPIPGFYLNKEHTRKWWKKEQFLPKAADRLTYPEWMKTGQKSCIDYAKKRMEEILATHKPDALTAEQDKEIEDILDEARILYKQKGLI
jgi:trimethylamine--corrinoid protein Co-methyltransferase